MRTVSAILLTISLAACAPRVPDVRADAAAEQVKADKIACQAEADYKLASNVLTRANMGFSNQRSHDGISNAMADQMVIDCMKSKGYS